VKVEPAARKMNVLAFIHFHRLRSATGVGRVTRELLYALARRQQIQLQLMGAAEDYKSLVSAGFELPASASVHLFSRSRKVQQAIWLTLKQPPTEHYWNDLDLVWCPAESYVPAARGRLVITLHDASHLEPVMQKARRGIAVQRMKWWWMFQRFRRDGAAFVTVSRYSADRLLHYYPWMQGRISVVPNAVSSRFLCPPSAEGDTELGKVELSGRRFVLVPGGLTPRKNGGLIAEAWGIIRRAGINVLLVIAGRCDEELAARCRSLGPEVRILGFVSDEAMRSLYGHAEVVWFPSIYEGFGMPVLEAMASGAPVVCCPAGAIPEVAGDAAILVPTDEPGRHAEAIVALLQQPALREEFVARGAQRAREFSWDASAARLEQVFRHVLENAPQTANGC
jgi:glycosyltransferase involved in cell wall biosynthesis